VEPDWRRDPDALVVLCVVRGIDRGLTGLVPPMRDTPPTEVEMDTVPIPRKRDCSTPSRASVRGLALAALAAPIFIIGTVNQGVPVSSRGGDLRAYP